MGEPDESVETVEEETERAPVQYVVWTHEFDFQTRELSGNDLVALGADAEDERLPKDRRQAALGWNPSNAWRVARSEIPLNDIQLGGLLALEKSFRLVER